MSSSFTIPPTTGPWAGMTEEQLRANLAAAQAALMSLLTGAKATTLSYSQGDGQRLVTYSRTDEGKLRNLIRELNFALGQGQRQAIGVRFA